MKRFILSTLILSVPLALYTQQLQSEPDILASVHRAYNFEQQGFAEISAVSELQPESPITSFVMASAQYWIFQTDRTNREKQQNAEYWLTQALDNAEAAYQDNSTDPVAQMFYGLSSCNRARFYVEQGKWWSSYRDARRGIRLLKDLLKDHPEMYDAHFALGVAEAFLSDAPAIVKPLALLMGFRGRAEKGIEMLNLARDQGYWTQTEALYFLAYYYYTVTRERQLAAQYFQELHDVYPQNVIFAYYLGRCYEDEGDLSKAKELYLSGFENGLTQGSDDFANWCLYRLAMISVETTGIDDSLAYFAQLESRLGDHTIEQEYHYRLDVKRGIALLIAGRKADAYQYLVRVERSLDRGAYREAQNLLEEHFPNGLNT